MPNCRVVSLAAMTSLFVSACSGEGIPSEVDSEPDASGTEASASELPASLAPFGNGYPNAGDPCQRLGESPATAEWLDDSAILVGCPSSQAASGITGVHVGLVDGAIIISVPTSNSNVEMPANSPPLRHPLEASSPTTAATAVSLAELEAKCRSAVQSTVGATVLSIISSDFSEAGTIFKFAVEGAEAPWQCIGYSNGTVDGVMYTGNEGSL